MTGIVRGIERNFLKLAVINGFLTLLMMLVIVADIIGRGFFNKPISGANELATLFLVALIFIGMAAAQVRQQHYNVDLIYGLFPPRAKRVCDTINSLAAMGFAGLLAWLTIEGAWTSFEKGEASYAVIAFPIWPSRFVLAFGLTCLAVQFLFDVLRNLGLIDDYQDHENITEDPEARI